jgi:excisionase family DNA binding protein
MQSKMNRRIDPELLGMAEAEAMTGVSRWTFRRWAYAGRISSVKLGNRLMISRVELDRVIAEGTRPRLQDAHK